MDPWKMKLFGRVFHRSGVFFTPLLDMGGFPEVHLLHATLFIRTLMTCQCLQKITVAVQCRDVPKLRQVATGWTDDCILWL
jgi:hypothetical protein